MVGSSGANSRSTAPVLSETKRTFSQLAPPSRLRYTPRSGFGAKGLPMAATYTRSGSSGWMRIAPLFPVRSSPMCVHVWPASVDL